MPLRPHAQLRHHKWVASIARRASWTHLGGDSFDPTALVDLQADKICPDVKALDLSFSPAVARLDNLHILVCLTSIDCTGCHLDTLPSDLPKSLARVALRRNIFRKVPESLFDLPSLTFLDLAKNELTELPAEFSRLTSLRHLELEYNRLGKLSPALRSLHSLAFLNLSGSELTTLPDDAPPCWPDMNVLLLTGNGLRTLPSSVTAFTKLHLIDVARNPILELPDDVAGLARVDPPRLRSPLPDCIVQGVYLGGIDAAHNKDALVHLNVTHILTVSRQIPPAFPEVFAYHVIEAADNHQEDLAAAFEAAFNFIEDAHAKGSCTLVHCQQGVSRSATIVTAYLMKKRKWSYSDALDFVRSRRPVVNPNSHFREQLVAFDTMLRAGVADDVSQEGEHAHAS